MTRVTLVLSLELLCLPLSAVPISPSLHAIILDIGASLGVPRSIADGLQIEESGDWHTGQWGDASQVGPVGADGYRCKGLYQLNPRILAWLIENFYPHPAKYFDVWNPCDNAVVALGYLAAKHKRYGSWERALWYFNSGRVKDVPRSTREYAQRIIER